MPEATSIADGSLCFCVSQALSSSVLRPAMASRVLAFWPGDDITQHGTDLNKVRWQCVCSSCALERLQCCKCGELGLITL